jgi:glutamate N-acetyltransferase / amino-acid N-acetyltransferase
MENWKLARNFRFAGVHCGIRPNSDPGRLDLALIVSDTPASAAGVFTQNQVVAAPVRVCRERLPSSQARGIVICSGNANACTGDQGLKDARRMAECASGALGFSSEQMLVASTGVIGRLMPMPCVEQGIALAARELAAGAEAFQQAARAILTTDTRIKVSSRSCSTEAIHVTGFCKGAAMIGPNMATLLAFVLTDAAVSAEDLAAMAGRAADRSFNCISVEGHTSTNDSLIFLANGTGPKLQGEALREFELEAIAVCVDLAQEIARDAEGASHFVTIDVEGLRNDAEARKIAKAVADSPLVKTALFGGDPNWGRIVSAAGYAGVDFAETQLSLWLGDFLLYQAGSPLPFDAATVSAFIKNHRDLTLRLVFTLGKGRCTFYTCDLTEEYVHLNADYTT